MNTHLVITVGQTDVQLVIENQRRKLDGDRCGELHDAIKARSWSIIDAPASKNREPIKELPEGRLLLCTPKLDAVLERMGPSRSTSVLILETQRNDRRDPRLSGEIVEQRLRERGVENVKRVAFLTGRESLEDLSNEADAVVRREVVARLSNAIGEFVAGLKRDDRVFVATTGGLAAANALVEELVRLHCVGGPKVTALEVPDARNGQLDDRAVEEKFHPAAGYRARWQALFLVERGDFLGAWGIASHLKDAPGQGWTQIIEWLARFASALPLPPACDLAVLRHPRMAVRSALRVELALRAGDIPRAVHGTVAFYESALWDHLLECFGSTGKKKRGKQVLQLKSGASPPTGENLLRNGQSDDQEKRNCPFERLDGDTYLFFEDGAGRFARDYVKSANLKKLVDAISEVKDLRNDVAHNEPTPELMESARERMQQASLWSATGDVRFLSQPIVQDVLKELDEPQPEKLCTDLLAKVRSRLLSPAPSAKGET